MKIQKKNLILGALALAAAIGGASAQAATQTLCENIAGPAGYLSVQKGIVKGGCPTGYAIRWSTPSDGLAILNPAQLDSISPPYRVTRVALDGIGQPQNYTIREVVDGITVCSIRSEPYNFFREVGAYVPSCRINGSQTIANTWRLYKVFEPSIQAPASGGAAKLQVALNSRLNKPTLTYVVRTTANLNGQSTTVNKPSLTGSGQYSLADLAPSLVERAQQGASFTFDVEVFEGPQSIARSSASATGAQLVGN